MPETIVLTVGAEVASGPTIKESRTLTVDAYDKLSVTVPDGTTNLEVQLQPGATGSVRLLIVKSSQYGDALKYTVNTGTTDHVLDQPHVLTGTGAVGLFGSEPTKLVFDNALGKDAQIQILVGRDATP
ncbi:MAG: hypothetical protein ABR521_02565 [Gaiellaceae bacterium]